MYGVGSLGCVVFRAGIISIVYGPLGALFFWVVSVSWLLGYSLSLLLTLLHVTIFSLLFKNAARSLGRELRD